MTDDQSAPTPPTPPVGPPTNSAAPVAPPAPTAPIAPPVAPVARIRTHKKLLRIGASVAVALVVILLKVGAVAGITDLFKTDHHKAGEAERSVNVFLQASTESGQDAVISGGSLKGMVFDSSCQSLAGMGEGTKYRIDSSSLESDGTADVYATVDNGPKLTFHLVNTTGSWLIDALHCS